MRFSKNGGGNPTLNMLTIFVNWSRSSCFIYNKDVYVLKTEECATLNFGVRFKSVMQHCVQFSKNNCEVTTLNMLIIFVNWYISSCYIYTEDVSFLKTEECAILKFGVRFESVVHHCVQFSRKNREFSCCSRVSCLD